MEIHKKYQPINLLKWAQLSFVTAWFLFLATLLTIPLPYMGPGDGKFTWKDKLVHIFLFGWLTRLIAGWLDRYTKLTRPKIIIITGVFGVLGSAFFEWIQNFIPGRSVSDWDLFAGVVGVVAALVIWNYWQGHFSSRQRKPKLLLHMCCGPCGSALSGQLASDYELTLFFCNPNIDTEEEFNRRATEAIKVAKYWNLPALVAAYNHKAWRRRVKGLEHEPEKGARCAVCFAARLDITAREAKRLGFMAFSTTLSVSPYKSYEQVLVAGRAVAKKYRIKFIETDFKKQDGYKKSTSTAKKMQLYT